MTLFRSTKGRKLRRSYPIHAYVGANGGGKSAAMVWDTIPALLAGRPVLSTVRILDFENPRPCDDPACPVDHDEYRAGTGNEHMAAHPLFVPFTRWPQLTEFRRGEVLMDEVTGVASSRDSHRMPGPVLNHLMQLRRADVVLRWSAPSWRRADTGIREVSQAVTACRGFVKKPVPSDDPALERAWTHRRLFLWKTYDAFAFDEFDTAMTVAGPGQSRARLRAMKAELHWGPGSPAFSAYDTFDAVSAIGTVSESGRCMVCDGRRSAPTCTCPDYVAPRRGARRALEVAPAPGSPRSGVGEGTTAGPDGLDLGDVDGVGA